jgi:hypothetical protein
VARGAAAKRAVEVRPRTPRPRSSAASGPPRPSSQSLARTRRWPHDPHAGPGCATP